MKKDEIKQKRPFAPGIQWQLMLFIGGITLFTLLLVWGIITYALEPQYNRNIRAKLDSKAAAITALIDQSDAEISSRTYQGLYLNDEFWSGVSQTFRDKKINVDGNCVDFSDSTLRCLKAYESMYPCLLHESTGAFGGEFGYNLDTRIAIQLRQKLFQDGSLYQIVKIGSSMQMCVGRLSADGQYGVIVSASLAQITTAAEVLRAILGPVALILLVLDLLLAILFSRWFTNPIRKLSNGAQEIASGNYDVQIKVERHDEIGRLAEDFNHMAAEVKRSAQLEKDILANVSHDLRTPLTSIYGACSTVIDNYDSLGREQKIKLLSEACADAQWLNRMVENLLSVTRIDADGVAIQKTPTVLEELVDTVLVRFQKLHPGVPVEVKLPDDFIVIPMDSMLIQQVLTNLLENAVLHAKGMTRLTLRVFTLGQRAVFEIIDNGCGIPKERLKTLFTGTTLTQDTSSGGKHGMGIGLSVCAAIIKAHGGEIKAESTPGEGTTIRFWLETEEVDTEETEDEQ